VGCYGCYGSSCYGCYGSSCYGCSGCYGGVAVVPTAPGTQAYVANPLPTQGTVIVQLPSEARLYVDGQLANLTSATRTVVTPELKPNQDYFYAIKAEATVDGKVVTQTKRVTVQAGKLVRIDFADLKQSDEVQTAATVPANVTVRLPEDAKLYVDGVACPLTSSTRSFATPALEPGRAYHYTLKAEVVREGNTQVKTRQVTVHAGKAVEVDFGSMGPVGSVRR
jgi:uncharacterized protein (TIGR03000 family)